MRSIIIIGIGIVSIIVAIPETGPRTTTLTLDRGGRFGREETGGTFFKHPKEEILVVVGVELRSLDCVCFDDDASIIDDWRHGSNIRCGQNKYLMHKIQIQIFT